MYEEGIIKWESILTILIGIVLVAFFVLLLYRRRKAKRKQIEYEKSIHSKNADLSNPTLKNNNKNIIDYSD